MPSRRRMIQTTLAALPTAFAGQGAAAAEIAPTLGAIRGVTITAGDLKAVEHAWTEYMASVLVA